MKPIVMMFSVLFLVSCATINSSTGLYGPQVPTDEVSGSYAQAKRSFVINFDTTDAMAAAKKAFNLEGLTFDVVRPNMVSGAGFWGGTVDGCECSYAVYVEEIDKSPKTRVTFVGDYQVFRASLFASTNVNQFIGKVSSHFNNIIASYE